MNDSTIQELYSPVRNRLKRPKTSYKTLPQSNKRMGDKGMGDIWEKASRIARSDIEALRLLNSADIMSMNLSSSNDHVPRPQTPPPTQKPSHMPITEQVPITTP